MTGAKTAPPIAAERVVAATPESAFAFLEALENHWRLTGRWIRVLSLDGDGTGGRVQMRAPLGLRRTAATRVLSSHAPERLEGLAEVGRTRTRVSWRLGTVPEGTRVTLEATVLEAGPVDRVVLACGGRAWLRRRFAAALAELDSRLTNPDDRGSAASD